MTSESRIYPAKILLLGEYTVTTGGSALAIPYPRFYARWVEDDRYYNLLLEFYAFLESMKFPFIDYAHLRKLKESGKGLECNIPIGYGLGSSGAITAAVYDMTCLDIEKKTPDVIQKELAQMEDFYHGASSGIDPLVSLLNRSVVVSENGINVQTQVVQMPQEEWRLFLYDSGEPRSSQSFIRDFTMKSAEPGFRKDFVNPIQKIVDTLIRDFPGEPGALKVKFAEISTLQFQYMNPMILDAIKELWTQGIESEEYFFKLCGAGGGGMYLVLGTVNSTESFSQFLIPL